MLRSLKINKKDGSILLNIPGSWGRYGSRVKNFAHDNIHFFTNPDILKYISHSCFSLYIKDKALYEEATKNMSNYIIAVGEPANENELDLMENDCKKVLCNSLPKGKYQFKIIFKSMPLKVRESFIRWADSFNNAEVDVPPITHQFFNGRNNRIYNTHYAYVRDEGIKMLAILAAQGYIRRIEEFVLRSQINNEIHQEQTCPL